MIFVTIVTNILYLIDLREDKYVALKNGYNYENNLITVIFP